MSHTEIDQLIRHFAKLPGLGPRSARRVVLHLLRQKDTALPPFIEAMEQAKNNVKHCSMCGNLDTSDPCGICTDPKREHTTLCVVEEVADLWAIERCNLYKGQYHVLGGTLSAMDGRTPDMLNIDTLIERALPEDVSEIILATNATVEGQMTAHYLTERLEPCHVTITQLAQGIPMGGELDYLDDGTLGTALNARLPM